METQINYTESDLSIVDYVSILQTEHRNTSDIRINYVSNVEMIIYDQTHSNDVTIEPILPGKRKQHFFYFFLTYYMNYCILFMVPTGPGNREKSGFSLILAQIREKSGILKSADEKLKSSTSKNGGCSKTIFNVCRK